MMLALPISDQMKGVARYYRAICIKQQGDFDGARRMLERVVEEALPQYKARALLTIGATYYERGEADAALPFYLAAGRASVERDPLTFAESERMVAVVRSIHGDHKQALALLENIFPLAQTIGRHYPAAYYDFLNSVAVELGEVGRIHEARAACSIALASPFASAYPEWTETRDDLVAKPTSATPSVVAFNQAPEAIPAPQPEPQPEQNAEAVILHLYSDNQTSQETISSIAAGTVIIPNAASRTTLARLGESFRSRAPPALF